MEPLVEARNVSLSYPDTVNAFQKIFKGQKSNAKTVLKDINFKIFAGERLALIGLNGSGKSTLLRVIAGIYPPDSGEMIVRGNSQALFNIGIGMRPDMTGRENIMLQGIIAGKTKSEMFDLMPEILEFSELEPVIDAPIRTYSQGMAMRLTFSVATALQPEILILDEWIGAGDTKFKEKANRRLSGLVENAKAFVLASHHAAVVQRYCQKAIWLHDGVIRMSGESEEVLAHYREHIKTLP